MKLHFGEMFNQPIDNDILPTSLERLTFHANSEFNHHLIPGVLPRSLKELHIGGSFNHSIEPNVLPSSLEI